MSNVHHYSQSTSNDQKMYCEYIETKQKYLKYALKKGTQVIKTGFTVNDGDCTHDVNGFVLLGACLMVIKYSTSIFTSCHFI